MRERREGGWKGGEGTGGKAAKRRIEENMEGWFIEAMQRICPSITLSGQKGKSNSKCDRA